MSEYALGGIYVIYQKIDELVAYGVETGLIKDSDRTYVRNRLLTKLNLDDYVTETEYE